MSTCQGCKKTIWFVPIRKDEEVGYVIRGGARETQYQPVARCVRCHLKGKAVKAVNSTVRKTAVPLAWFAISLILFTLGVNWFENEKPYTSGSTIAVSAVAPPSMLAESSSRR
jgi:hypothetical protein